MCDFCGCSDDATPMVTNLENGTVLAMDDNGEVRRVHHHDHDHDHDHDHSHDHDHDHDHGHAGPAGRTVVHLHERVLQRNDQFAERNRGWFAGRKVRAFNLMSSPGSGKTTILERTIRALAGELTISVIEGDQATLEDSKQIRATGCRVVQINTGTGCHLEAHMVAEGLEQLDPPMNSVVMIENVGNLVCPALFDLGEHRKIVIASVTEGDNKPIKYPHMFRGADLILLNKTDLLPYVQFDVDRFLDNARQINPQADVLKVSATEVDGLQDWYDWLRRQDSSTDRHDSQTQSATRHDG